MIPGGLPRPSPEAGATHYYQRHAVKRSEQTLCADVMTENEAVPLEYCCDESRLWGSLLLVLEGS